MSFKKGDILRQYEVNGYVVYELLEDPKNYHCKVRFLHIDDSIKLMWEVGEIRESWMIYSKNQCRLKEEHYAKKVPAYNSKLYKVINNGI